MTSIYSPLAAAPSSGAVSGAGEVATFGDLPAANTVTPGRVYTVLAPVCTGGAYGTRWASDGSLWRPAGGQVLWALAAQVDGVAGGTTAEQLLASVQFPAGVFAGCRAIALRARWSASGTDSNTRVLRWRVGTAGSSADAIVSQTSSASASHRTFLQPGHVSPSGTTGLLPTYQSGSAQSWDTFTSSTAAPGAAITVPSMTSNALYVSASVQQGASPSATISLERAWIYVE